MALYVEQMAQKNNFDDLECIQCGECIDICPAGGISVSQSNPYSTSAKFQPDFKSASRPRWSLMNLAK
jgi:Fe-S-cluster-containing hydrogenase component 2